jgi:hypothetical protein
MRGPRIVWNTALTLVLGLGTVAAQSPLTNERDIGQRMKHNSEVLQHYAYKRCAQITLKGEPRGERVDLVRTVEGHKEMIPLEPQERTTEVGSRRGLRGKIVERKIEKKKEEMSAEMERLKELMNSYLAPGANSVGSILHNAKVSRIGSGADANIQLIATGLKRPSDSFTVIWSRAHNRPVSVEIRADVDGKPVQLNVQYANLPDGTFYPARTVITVPKKNIALTITTFDYALSAEKSP